MVKKDNPQDTAQSEQKLVNHFNDDMMDIDDEDELDELLAEEEEAELRKKYDAKVDVPFMSKQIAQSRGIRFKNEEDVAARLSPGKMVGGVNILLHTRQAHRLYHGRRRDDTKGIQPVTGLIRFAGQMNNIWTGAGRDDPYADYFLLEIEQALELASDTIRALSDDLQQKLDQLAQRGYRITLQESTQPIELTLKFAPEFTHKAAMVLLDYDFLARQVLSLRHAAALDRTLAKRYLNHAASRIRAAFELSVRYKRTQVTRDDIAANNPKAQDAAIKMNIVLPQGILEGLVRAQMVPPLPPKRQKVIDLARQASARRQAAKEAGAVSNSKKTGTVKVVTKKKKPGPDIESE